MYSLSQWSNCTDKNQLNGMYRNKTHKKRWNKNETYKNDINRNEI